MGASFLLGTAPGVGAFGVRGCIRKIKILRGRLRDDNMVSPYAEGLRSPQLDDRRKLG